MNLNEVLTNSEAALPPADHFRYYTSPLSRGSGADAIFLQQGAAPA